MKFRIKNEIKLLHDLECWKNSHFVSHQQLYFSLTHRHTRRCAVTILPWILQRDWVGGCTMAVGSVVTPSFSCVHCIASSLNVARDRCATRKKKEEAWPGNSGPIRGRVTSVGTTNCSGSYGRSLAHVRYRPEAVYRTPLGGAHAGRRRRRRV